MAYKLIKTTTAVAALLIGAAFVSNAAQAQTTVQASITTDASITVVDGQDMDFGTWLLIYRNADAFELTMATNGAITANNLAGGPTNSLAQEIVAVDQQADMTVELPAGASNVVINMQRGAITDFPSVALTLQNTTYATATEVGNNVLAAATNVPVTVIAGGTPETVSFGAEIAVTGQPADATHTASFIVTFAY